MKITTYWTVPDPVLRPDVELADLREMTMADENKGMVAAGAAWCGVISAFCGGCSRSILLWDVGHRRCASSTGGSSAAQSRR